jgi:transposase InsO family protein
VLFAFAYLLLRWLFQLVTRSSNDLTRDVEVVVLRHQLMVLRRQVSKPRLRRRDRLFMAALSRALPRARWSSSFVVTPQTLLRWHRELVRRKWTYKRISVGGRPPITDEVRELIVRMGRDNPRWGCLRIRGELAKLGVRVPDPGPGLQVLPPLRRGLPDRRSEHRQDADPGPETNAFAERWVRTVRTECLDWMLVLGRRHLERVLRTYTTHYNEARPHRGLDLKTPEPQPDSLPRPALGGRVRRHDLLGGLIHEYELAA